MSYGINSFQNNNLNALVGRAPQHVTASIQQASARTGVDFAYLMEQAAAESSFKADAKAPTSSATGLYQFIETTWLDMVKRHGDQYGLKHLADKIDSNLRVSDRAARREILNLRNDPQVASYMAAEFAADNKAYLEQNLGGQVGSTEMYFAHFLGAAGATGFLKELAHNPLTIAADIMPRAARANRAVFYDSQTGQPRTLQQVYDFFDKKFSGEAARIPSVMAAAQQEAAPRTHTAMAAAPRTNSIVDTIIWNQPERVLPKEEAFHPAEQRVTRRTNFNRTPADTLTAAVSSERPAAAKDLNDYRSNSVPVIRVAEAASAPSASSVNAATNPIPAYLNRNYAVRISDILKLSIPNS